MASQKHMHPFLEQQTGSKQKLKPVSIIKVMEDDKSLCFKFEEKKSLMTFKPK